MNQAMSKMVLLAVLWVGLVGCGELADPVEGPVEEVAVATRGAEQGLDFEQGIDLERAQPVLRKVQRCDGCATLYVLYATSDGANDEENDQTDTGDTVELDEVSDGNPVPFPLDEKNPFLD